MQSGNTDATHPHGWLVAYDEIGAYKPLSIRALRPRAGRERHAPQEGAKSAHRSGAIPTTNMTPCASDRLRYQGNPGNPARARRSCGEAGGKQVTELYEAWIAADRQGVRVLITGPVGFERTVQFTLDADSFEITERVRATLED
jgi:hypothetical protein